MLTSAYDTYGFYIALPDGSQTRHFQKIQLPKELPDMNAKKIVNTFQMDEGLNHPGYRVYDSRKIDLSHYDFPIKVGGIPSADLDWLDTAFQQQKQMLISWKLNFRVLAVWQENGFIRHEYPGNVREFGWAELAFHLAGQTNTVFS